LLIACSNIANLLLARASSRRHEVSVRLAIGAGPTRIVRQFLAESLVLGLLGGCVGLAIGHEGCEVLWTLRPTDVAANMVSPRFDWSVLFFALGVSLVTGLLFGVIPAVRAGRTDVLEGLKQETRIAGLGRGRVTFANALLAGQVALSLVSLTTAGLFLRGIERAYRIDPGFDAGHLALFMLNPEQAGYSQVRTKEFYRDLRETLSHIPNVAAASWASNLPFWSTPSRTLLIEGREELKRSERPVAIVNTVDLAYFSAMQIPLLEGRDFNANDGDGSAPVALVNEYLAQKYWPGSSAIGRRIRFADDPQARQIVGVTKTSNYSGLGERPQMCVYLPLRQNLVEGVTLYVRAAGDPTSIMGVVQRELHRAAPSIEVSDVRTGRKLIGQVLFFQSIGVGMLSVFGLLALVLASVGLYGLQAYSVSRRHREIGVRMAIGASRSDVLRLILRQGMTLAAAGIGVGLPFSVAVGRTLSTMLFGVSPYDPASLFGGTAVLMLAALAASVVPAYAATRVDPITGLRAD
ncbi:MAG: FtsX-like permease family protein, partial [Vicinamibacterales bacterium]